jgi:short-subunit dehydrogenase
VGQEHFIVNINGRIMVVTGASSGIGAATARAAGRERARLVLLARNQAKLEEVAEDIRRNGGAAHPYAVDLTVADAVAEVAKRITTDLGTPDIIFNNAGVGKWLSVAETDPDEAVKMMASPYFAAFFVTRAFLPEMLKRNSGYIVNMTSAASRLVWPGATAYIAARWAMHGFTEGLRADLNGTGVRVMLASFAKVASSYWENNPGSEERLPKAQSMIRVLTPDEAAQAIIDGIKREKKEVVAPFMLRFVFGLNYLFPGTTRRMMTAGGNRP